MQYTSTTWLDILVEQYAIYSVNFGNCPESDWCLALISSSCGGDDEILLLKFLQKKW